MDVNLAELTEKVSAKISILDDEKIEIQNRLKGIENEKTAMQKHFKAIDNVSALVDEFAMEEMVTAESEDDLVSDRGDPVEPEVLTTDSDIEGKSDKTQNGKAKKGDVLSYLKEQLDAEDTDDAQLTRDDEALSLRA